jgi:predicted amidohydrolase YtcJ
MHLASHRTRVYGKSLYERGATVSIGTDWFLLETPNLFAGISGIVLRRGENLPLETVVRIVTKVAAEAARVKNKGVIEVGRRANFIVLDRNLLDAEELESTRVRKTYFEGKMVYDYDDDEDKDVFDKAGLLSEYLFCPLNDVLNCR